MVRRVKRNMSDKTSDIRLLPRCYPQLLLPIRAGMKDTPEYKNTVLRGEAVSGDAPRYAPEGSLTVAETPAGPVRILWLARREDFEHALRALAYRCEPREIPPSVGASTVLGLINWEKIRGHEAAYLAAGGADWAEEFRRFTADAKNYRDTLIILSNGNYSAVAAEELGLAPEVWTEKSLTIRKYHELTHFICRNLFPDDVDAIRDEILADLIGLTAAFGVYDPALARRFLGIGDGHFRPGGRLSHYAEEAALPAAVARAEALIGRYARQMPPDPVPIGEVFDLLLRLFPDRR